MRATGTRFLLFSYRGDIARSNCLFVTEITWLFPVLKKEKKEREGEMDERAMWFSVRHRSTKSSNHWTLSAPERSRSQNDICFMSRFSFQALAIKSAGSCPLSEAKWQTLLCFLSSSQLQNISVKQEQKSCFSFSFFEILESPIRFFFLSGFGMRYPISSNYDVILGEHDKLK